MRVPEAKTQRVKGSGVRAVAWILLVAFTLQSFITQTHIHAFDRGKGHVIAVAQAPAHRNVPTDRGKADCPFCQAIVHAGTFYAPAVQTFALPLSWSAIALSFFVAETFVSVSSHLWRSRAPPRY